MTALKWEQDSWAHVVGADGCAGGWIAASRDAGGAISVRRVDALAALFEAPWPRGVVAVDVPIGLPERESRDCDVEARRMLGVRSSSVFPAPIRAMLAAGSQAEASRIRHGAEGKRVSIQLWTAERIFAGIAISIPAVPALDAHRLRMEMMA